MSHKLIYSFLALGTLTIATACSSTESVDETLNDGVTVKFTARTTDSRANYITTNTLIKNSPFLVYGDMVPTASASTATPSIVFSGTSVTCDKSTNTWQYANPQYWFPGHTHSFVAVHPGNTTELSNFQYQNGTLSFTYTLPENYKAAHDLITATHRRNYTLGAETTAPVAFQFNHALSRINFYAQVKNSQETPIVIDQLTLQNVHTSATYTISPASIVSGISTDDFSGEWSNHNEIPERGNLLFEYSMNPDDNGIIKGERRSLFGGTNLLFVVPQTIPENILLSIKYHAKTEGAQIIEDSAMLYPFTLQHGGEWLPGKSYTYTFSIGTDTDITFKAPVVESWDESLGGNYIIAD